MEELKLKAASYAEGKANEAITKAISQAYIDGYQAGYQDGKDEVPVTIPEDEDDSKFVDLGLTSGTLWAEEYEMEDGDVLYLPYGKAEEYHLPTEEQWGELKKECKFIKRLYTNTEELIYCDCIGPNGNSIRFKSTGLLIGDEKHDIHEVYVWLKSDVDGLNKKAANITRHYESIISRFSGYKLPVRVVK